MMSKGFITSASFQTTDDSEIEDIDLTLKDVCDPGQYQADDYIIEITCSVREWVISFNTNEAEALVEAMQEIINRYKK